MCECMPMRGDYLANSLELAQAEEGMTEKCVKMLEKN